MIIPVVCMNCGFDLADKWRYYQREVARRKVAQGKSAKQPIYIDGTQLPDTTAERQVCDELGITRYCCRKVMLTHRDLIDKV